MVFRDADGWIYRVPAKAHVREGFPIERELMSHLAARLPGATPVWQVAGDPPMTRYRAIPGQQFCRSMLRDGATCDRVLAELAAFLSRLHQMPPLPGLRASIEGKSMQRWAERLRHCEQFELADRLDRSVGQFVAAMADRPRVLCHGDFHGGNILIDVDAGKISGVIDFTDAMIAPPELDLARIGLPDPWLADLVDRYEACGGTRVDRDALAATSLYYACRMQAKHALRQAGDSRPRPKRVTDGPAPR